MEEERILAEAQGYERQAEASGDMGGGYAYRDTTVELMEAAVRLVTFAGALDRKEAIKALAILKSHEWRNDVLPFAYSRRVLPWAELEAVEMTPPEPPDGYGRLRFTYPQRSMLDRLTHMPVDIYFKADDRAAFDRVLDPARERIAAARVARPTAVSSETAAPAESSEAGSGGVDLAALERLAALHQQGILNDQEFAAAKARLLQ